jgi:AcrR family transcriptional regulator
MKQEFSTKHKILDAAQHLFAREGFKGTSLRAITKRAQVNLAAINYHFGSKETLLRAVIERHLTPLNQMRKERLEKAREKARTQGKRPMVNDLLLAIIEPTFQFMSKSPDAEDYIVLVGRAFYEPDGTVRRTVLQLVWPLFELVVELFIEALPEVPENILLWRLHFMFGAFSHMMLMCGSDFYEDFSGFPLDTDANTVIQTFSSFITAGMEA